jgi:isoamylase
MFLNGETILDRDVRGERIGDDSFLLLIHSGYVEMRTALPLGLMPQWEAVLDTAGHIETGNVILTSESLVRPPRSLLVLRSVSSPRAPAP